jgi:hypothetical protein
VVFIGEHVEALVGVGHQVAQPLRPCTVAVLHLLQDGGADDDVLDGGVLQKVHLAWQ